MEGTPPSAVLSNPRGSLGERIAARAGFNAPRLNTESARTFDLLPDSGIKSPIWTIPAGLSPTTLLDSPVFLSNSLVQPSPTTGKLPFFTSDNIMSSSLMLDSSNLNKNHFFSGVDSSPFTFKPEDNAEGLVQSENSLKDSPDVLTFY